MYHAHLLYNTLPLLYITLPLFHCRKEINSGRLPRKSIAALILLCSIDEALEKLDSDELQDWHVIIDNNPILFPEAYAERNKSWIPGIPRNISSMYLAMTRDDTRNLEKLHESMEIEDIEYMEEIDKMEDIKDIECIIENSDKNSVSVIISDSNRIEISDEKIIFENNDSNSEKCAQDFVIYSQKEGNIVSRTPFSNSTNVNEKSKRKTLRKSLNFDLEGLKKKTFDSMFEYVKESQKIYLLISFIEAHELAQRKLPELLGHGFENSMQQSVLFNKLVI